MKLSAVVVLITATLAAIPISLLVTSKFKYIDSEPNAKVDIPRNQQLHLQSINEKAFKYNQLGNNHDLIIDQVKAQAAQSHGNSGSSPTISEGSTDLETDLDFNSPALESSHSSSTSIASDFEIKSSRSFISDFFKYKAQQVEAQSMAKDSNPGLSTSIKNYGHSLNHQDDLKHYTSKVVQESKEDTDFRDYSFKKYWSSSESPQLNTLDFVPQLKMEEFIKYLTKYEGFKESDLQFLQNDGGLDYGADEIERELNRIKDQERIERKIEIDGENIGTRYSLRWSIVFAAIFCVL